MSKWLKKKKTKWANCGVATLSLYTYELDNVRSNEKGIQLDSSGLIAVYGGISCLLACYAYIGTIYYISAGSKIAGKKASPLFSIREPQNFINS